MNIQSTRPQQQRKLPSPGRTKAQEAFAEDRKVYEEAYDKYSSAFTKAQNAKERNTLIVGGATMAAAIGAMFVFGLDVQHGAQLAAPAILGGGIAWGVTHLATKGNVAKLKATADEAFKPMKETRDAYVNELLKEMDDEGVNQSWEAVSSKYLPYSTNERVDALAGLADARLGDDWNGKLARKQDDILKFYDQQAYIADNPAVRELIEE